MSDIYFPPTRLLLARMCYFLGFVVGIKTGLAVYICFLLLELVWFFEIRLVLHPGGELR